MPAVGNVPFNLWVDPAICHRCRRCLGAESCRGGAFRRFEVDEEPFIDMSRCWGCLVCISACPFDAIVKRGYGK
ncbi:MAG: 4Fe-4S binding protein [Anaerolineae bacterium]|nr:4Fe-4S binding protein [Anaerolineae bacterium]